MGSARVDMGNITDKIILTTASTTSNFIPYPDNYFSNYSATSPTHGEFEGPATCSPSLNSLSFQYHIFGSDQAIWIARQGMAPNIDAHINISLTRTGESQIHVVGAVTGDQFPSNEAYLRDEKGNTLMLGASGPISGTIAGPYSKLFQDRKSQMSSFDLNIMLNPDNSFKGVQLHNKYFTLADWNKQFLELDAQHCGGTNTTDSAIECLPLNIFSDK